MLKVQEFLEKNTFQKLIDQHGCYASFSKCGSFFSLNYDQIEVKDSDLLSQECRGLILSAKNGQSFKEQFKEENGKFQWNHICPGETKILALPFLRFFNEGQGSAAQIEWQDPNLTIQNKLDGTLKILYFNSITNSWETGTRARPQADQLVDSGKYTFRDLFEKAVEETLSCSFNNLTYQLDKNITYIFELMTPFNQIVCRYDGYKIALLGMRDLETFKEIDIYFSERVPEILKNICVESYPLKTLTDIINFVSLRNPVEFEGVVVKDSNFNRIKIKSPSYIALHRLRDSAASSPRNCLELILSGKEDDSIGLLPQEIVDDIMAMKEKVKFFIKLYDQRYKDIIYELSSIENPTQKDFALAVQKRKDLWQAPMFKLYAKKCDSMRDYINKFKQEDGSYSTSLLDKILEIIENL